MDVDLDVSPDGDAGVIVCDGKGRSYQNRMEWNLYSDMYPFELYGRPIFNKKGILVENNLESRILQNIFPDETAAYVFSSAL